MPAVENIPAPAPAATPTVPPAAPALPSDPPTTVAVIDVGTSSIRMAVGEVYKSGRTRSLEMLSQGVSLGKDTFTRGEIARETIEECVQVLKTYRHKLEEYGITRPDQVRVVATSAVREATNQLALIDRVYAATGFTVDPIEEAEVHRITYRSIQPLLKEDAELRSKHLIITEVGGGSTEVLRVDRGNVAYSHSFRLGSLRLRQTFRNLKASAARLRDIMEQEIHRTLEEFVEHVPNTEATALMGLGGDIRLATRVLLPDWDASTLARVPVEPLCELTERVLALGEDAVARQYHLALPEAETLGPALLVYRHLADMLKLEHILVSAANLRDGLLREAVDASVWTADFREQIIRSAIELGRKYHFDGAHGIHVAELTRQLFRGLQSEHGLDARHELILYIAAIVHEIGAFISTSSLHKHSMYLIMNSDLFGLSRSDVLLVGLVARYHRRASPKPTHQGFANLGRDSRVAVSKMAAILRLAKALDVTRSQRVRQVSVKRKGRKLIISAPDVEDLSVEQLAINQGRGLFDQIYGLQVVLRSATS